MPLPQLRAPSLEIVDRAAIAATIVLFVFGSLWAVTRFSLALGELAWMQRAYDEPFYLWRAFNHEFGIDNRLLGNLLTAALGSVTRSFDAAAEIPNAVLPLVTLAGAWLLAGTWDRAVIPRLVWTLLLVFAYDLLSFSNVVLFDTLPASWVAKVIGDPRIWKVDAMEFFLAYRRPEPQTALAIFFFYVAGVVGSFTDWRPRLYRIVCAVTPLLVVVYINVALIGIIVFCLTSVIAIVIYRRPILPTFGLSVAATVAAFGIAVFANPASKLEGNTFATHLPILRPSVVMALLCLAGLAVAVARRAWTPLPRHWLAAAFLVVPLITLNQQIVTGVAVLPQNWEMNGNYICTVAGIAILVTGWLQDKGIGNSVVTRSIFTGLWILLAAVVIRGHLRVETNFTPRNAESVAYARAYREAVAAVGRVDLVVLPHLFDESPFVTRVPKGTTVLGGYNWLILNPPPRWRAEHTVLEHAQHARRNFDVGFETLARLGVSPAAVGASLQEEVRTARCWPMLMYFFSQSDCWPTFSNFSSPNRARMTSIAQPLEKLYAEYLQKTRSMRDGQAVLLITNAPLPDAAQLGVFDNRQVAAVVVRVRTYEARAYAYLQTMR